MKIFIKEDTDSEMIQILTDEDICLFEGNYWDFDFSGKSVENLFKKVGLKVELTDLPYDKWYE